MTIGQGAEIGSFNFPVIRIILGIGLTRILVRNERPSGAMNGMDWVVVTFCCWAVVSSLFHKDPSAALKFSSGLVYNTAGIYFLVRSLCRSSEEAQHLCIMVAVLLVPVAAEMLLEKATGHNLFSAFGGVPESPEVRDGAIRAQGPFRHAILAGTVGAVMLPWVVGVWKRHRAIVCMGVAACLAMIFSSASSGPIMSAVFGIVALCMWKWRHMMCLFRRLAIPAYIVLDLIMKAPAYYLIARIDLTGGSTGWHRARLIESAIEHFGEWWFTGTDYTRHWMATGVGWSEDHTDITNHYLHMGVLGGLPLMLLFILLLGVGFSYVGKTLQASRDSFLPERFAIWALGASLFAHAATCISVSYFDQSFVFLYLVLGAIGSVWSSMSAEHRMASGTMVPPDEEPMGRAVG